MLSMVVGNIVNYKGVARAFSMVVGIVVLWGMLVNARLAGP